MKKRNILITGVSGLVGSHLLDRLLERGEHVTGIDDLSYGKLANIRKHFKNKHFRFHKIDILDLSSMLKKIGPVDVILHMAAVKKIGEQDPALPTLRVNGLGTENVLRLAMKRKAKVILGSTSDVYGLSERIPFREDSESVIGPSTVKRWAYAVSKLYSEHLGMSYHKDLGVPVVILRYFGAFSERASTAWSGGHIPIFIDAVLKGKPVIIHGDGKQTRSMGHVSDIVTGTLLAMDDPGAVGEIINIGNDEELSILESAKKIHRLSGTLKPLKIKFVPMKSVFGAYREISRRVPDLGKAKRLLGYSPRVSFEEALRQIILKRKNKR